MPQLRIDKLSYPADISLLRLDLVDPYISGNKWFKLKYNLLDARRAGYGTVLTFGGAYSNHIYATAAAAKNENLRSIGIIRGEATEPLNETLTYAAAQGMELHFMSRSDYRRKNEPEFLKELKQKFGDAYIIPEGGSNSLAVKGVAEIIDEVNEHFDLWITSVGTGGTMAGLVAGLRGKAGVLGISSLKGAYGLNTTIHDLLNKSCLSDPGDWQINHDYHFGGYAKMTEELLAFISDFKKKNGILTDPVYTGKMMFAVEDLVKKGQIPQNKKILAIHTGGLQGWNGMVRRYGFVKGWP